jgi:8-oxo-dGTP pyrophosphatase MutT (NUDIX family)
MEKHFTATAYIIEDEKVLLLLHPKLNKWLPPGGHIELNETPPECACRETLEETGLTIEIIPQENLWIEAWNATSFARPYLCLLEEIPAHGTSSAHQHMDFIYLARPIGGKLLEGVQWFSLNEVEELKDDLDIFGETKKTIQHLFSLSVTK